jgi:GT2 family glycosyltransferase
MSDITLSIVIGTYNRIDLLCQCLDSLIGRIKVSHEIIVVDAGSTDGTLEYLRNLQGIRLITDQERLGQAQSLNRVFRTLRSEFVCWLSDDNIVQSNMLDKAVTILKSDPAIGMVSLRVKDVRGPFTNQDYLGGIWPTGILNCNQGMLPVKLLKEIGGFDEQFRDYGIDSDLTTQVLLAGYKVVFTKKVAIHHLRDHETESWTDANGRKLKMERAKELYRLKYEELIGSHFDGHYDKRERNSSPRLKGIHRYYAGVGKRSISLRDWIDLVKADWIILFVTLGMLMGLLEKDWRNLFVARFVSKWDFLTNIYKPYYLVQSIPNELLHELQGRKNDSFLVSSTIDPARRMEE